MRVSHLVKKFMEETGYTNTTTEYFGVQKFRRGSARVWDYNPPDKMLKDFAKWMSKQNTHD